MKLVQNKNVIFYPDYCYRDVRLRPKLGQSDGRLHIYLSEAIHETGTYTDDPMSLRPVIEQLLQFDFINLYICASNSLGVNIDEHYPGYAKLAHDNHNLSIRATTSEMEFLEEISCYDIMLSGVTPFPPIYPGRSKITNNHKRFYYSNKFADCLDTDTIFCIPAYDGREFNVWLAERMGVCLRPDLNEFKPPKTITIHFV